MGVGCTRNRPPPEACEPPRGRVEAHDGVARWTDFPPATTQRRVLALMGSRGSTTCRCESQSICATSETMRDWGYSLDGLLSKSGRRLSFPGRCLTSRV